MSTNVTTLPPASLRRSWPLRLSILGVSFLVLTYYALYHGSYSLIDRQQIAVFVWVAIGVAAVCGVLPAVKPPRVLLIPLLAILGMAAWTLLSLTWTESAERTFAEFARIIGYLGVLVLIWTGVGRTTWRLVAAGLLSAGVLVCFLTLMSRLWPSVFPSDTVAASLNTTRISYPFGYWNAVGCWSAMTVALCLAYAGHARSAVVRGLSLAVVPMCAAGLFLAVSRAGFGGAILGIGVVLVLSRSRWLTFIQALLAAAGSAILMVSINQNPEIALGQGSRGAWSVGSVALASGMVLFAIGFVGRRLGLGHRLRMKTTIGRPLALVGVGIALVAFVAGVATFGGQAYDEFSGRSTQSVSKASPDRLAQLNGNRHNLWDSAWDAFERHPAGGIGPGTFEFWWNRNGANGEFVRDAHNLYLETLAEAGIVGLMLLLTFFFGLLLASLASRRSMIRSGSDGVGIQGGLIAAFVVFSFQAALDWMWESTAVAVFALGAIGVATVTFNPSRGKANGAAGSIGLLVASALLAILLLPGLSSQRQLEKSQAAFRAKHYSASASAASGSIGAASWSATAHAQRALALVELGDLPRARIAIMEAETREPFNWRWPYIAAQIAVKLGDPGDSAAALGRARQLRTFSPIFGVESPVIR